MTSKANYKVYMDVQIGATAAGRITFELFNDLTSKTCQNFRGLCTGEYGKVNNMKLHYLNTKFHRIIDGFVIQGGDISNSGGMGGYSIYGRTFVDENFARTHSCAGLLSMANSGRNTNSSQFFITLKACPHLDGKHVVFGQVIDGMEIVKKIAKVPIDKNNKPKYSVMIIDCGEIDDFRNFLRYDPFKKEVFDQIRQARQKIIMDQHAIRRLLSEGLDPNTAYDLKKNLETCQRNLANLNKRQQELQYQRNQKKTNKVDQKQPENEANQQGNQTAEINEKFRQKYGEKVVDKYMQLKLKINEAKANISKAVLLQQKKDNNDQYIKQEKKQQWLNRKSESEKQIIAKGLSSDKLYMNRIDHKKEQTQKQDLSFGWNIFGEQAYYKAYDKRCLALKKDPQLYEAQIKGQSTKISEEALNNLHQDILKQQQKRSKFSNVKIYDEDETVNYINERNRKFNQKLERNYGDYASSTKTALQHNSFKK